MISQAVYCHHCGTRVDGADEPNGNDSRGGSGGGQAADDPADRLRQPAGHGNSSDDDDDEERKLWMGRYSPKAMIGRWLLTLLVTVLLPIAGFYIQRSWAWWAILGIIVVLWLYQFGVMLYRQMSVRYRLTTQRFTHEHGILSRTTDRIELIDIDDIAFRQGLVERMVGVGTVEISSTDRSHPQLEMIGIENVRDVAQVIDDARRKERRRRGLHIESI